MFSFRGDNPLKWDNSKELIIQLIDWVTLNKPKDPEKPYEKRKYVIQATCLMADGTSVLLTINDFPPHFYVNIPDAFNDYNVRSLVSSVKHKLGRKSEDLDTYDVVNRKKFWGFTNNKNFKFLRILFKNSAVVNETVKILKSQKFSGIDFTDRIYESNLLPFLRFIHINNIKPAGWIKLPANMYVVHDRDFRQSTTTCQLSVETHWKKIKPIQNDNIAPMIIASFDIECYSSHGDFPLAKKKYKKLASEVYDSYYKVSKELLEKDDICQFIEYQIKRGFQHITKENHLDKFPHISISNVYTIDQETPGDIAIRKLAKALYNVFNTPINYKLLACDVLTEYTNNPKIYNFVDGGFVINRLICEGFSDDQSKNETKVSKLYTKVNRKPTVRSIRGVSDKLNIVYSKLYNKLNDIFNDNEKIFKLILIFNNAYTTTIDEKCDYLFDKETKHKNIQTPDVSREDYMKALKFVEMAINQMISVCQENFPEMDDSRDNNVHRITEIMDTFLPKIEGDEVIQIGTTIQKYGDQECCLKHIITLDTCDPIPGAIVESYKTEKEVLVAWTNFIRRLDPDFITGYNIFGFDFQYLWQRAESLECTQEFGKFSRIEKPSVLECKKLASSALGDNILSYITMEGRVQMDLLKIIQRDHNLVSYKLDYVAENFMNDIITRVEVEGGKIHIVRTTSLTIGNFITIKLKGDDKFCDGKKYKITNKNLDGGYIELDMSYTERSSLRDFIETGETPKWQLSKDDVTPKQIFEFQKQGADKRQIVAAYCLQDCALCINIINKLDLITNNIGMANVCSVPLSFIFLRGQGIKIFSLVAKECRNEGFLIPVIKCEQEEQIIHRGLNFDPEIDEQDKAKVANDGGFEGAIVLNPNPGIYLKSPVTVLDYSSLYPSCMISENLSHDSIVFDDKYLGEDGIIELKKIGYDYVDQTHDVYKWRDPNIKSKGKVKVGEKTCRFVQPPNGEKSIIPKILKKLLTARKETRAKIKTETDVFKKSVFDGLQLAYKITANSLYGQIGARTSSIYLKDIAASTTSKGRELLYLAKDKVEEKFEGAKIVYGDSVLGDTPIILKHIGTGNLVFKQIDDLYNQHKNNNKDSDWTPYEEFKPFDTNRREKQQHHCDDYLVWTAGGWSKINRVIRHKTKKTIHRVVTHDSVVDVTEDHSLLDKNGEIIKPGDLTIGTELLRNYPIINKTTGFDIDIHLQSILDYSDNVGVKSIDEKRAFIYGFFYGDGSCGSYDCPSGHKYSWTLNNSNMDLCLILQSLLIEIYGIEFKILDTIITSGVYKIVPVGQIKRFSEEYRSMFYNKDNYKVIPVETLNSCNETRYSFFSGYYAASSYKCINSNSKNIILTNKGKIGTAMLYYIAKSIGFNVSLNTRTDNPDIFKLTCTMKMNPISKKENSVKKNDIMYETNFEDYVYDIETMEGNFNTGFPLIVKNTDSIFIDFHPKDENGNPIYDKAALKSSIELGVKAEKYIQNFLKAPHKLEYEKTFYPFILFTKKRYIGHKYEFDPEKYEQTSMGIVLKRRDNAEIVKYIYGGIIDIIMKEKDLEKSIRFCKQALNELLAGKFPLEMLVITKSLKGYYKNPNQIAHKVLADRMGLRDPGNKPQSNDRIAYAYIDLNLGRNANVLQGDKIENPEFIRENDIKLDYKFYMTNQIMKPVCQIYALAVTELEGYTKPTNYFVRKYKSLLEKNAGDEDKTKRKIDELKNKEVEELVFSEALRKATNKKNNVREITDFFKCK
jgi:DNA polymerase elongation subunit (family B)